MGIAVTSKEDRGMIPLSSLTEGFRGDMSTRMGRLPDVVAGSGEGSMENLESHEESGDDAIEGGEGELGEVSKMWTWAGEKGSTEESLIFFSGIWAGRGSPQRFFECSCCFS
jgi:hypothetical protein